MQGRVQLISKEMMKPSPQTPHRFKNLKLSYIDRSLPSLYIPLIFFYNADESTGLTASNRHHISQKFKHSLLATLPSFYPLAGKIKHNFSVDCKDGAGVEFVEAKAHARLKTVMQESTVEDMKSYIPSECTTFDHARRPPLVVQVTFFDCGGLAVAICVSHKIADFTSALAFIAAWATKCRAENQGFSKPQLRLGTYPYFPPLRCVPFSLFTRIFKQSREFVTERFVFSKEKVEILRRAATSPSESVTEDPTRVELVSAFIWKHFMAARPKNLLERKIYAALVAVSLRPRTSPPGILDDVFGNCFMSPLAFAGSSRKFHHLVSRLRRAIRRVRDGYITKVVSRESYMKELATLGLLLMAGKLEWCYFTSWRGFETYEVDYGWGRPCRFATPSMPIKNLVVLVSSRSGDDVEAIVTMKQEVLQMVGSQIKLISSNNANLT